MLNISSLGWSHFTQLVDSVAVSLPIKKPNPLASISGHLKIFWFYYSPYLSQVRSGHPL